MESNVLETYKVADAASKLGVEIKPMISAPILLSEAAVINPIRVPAARPAKHLTLVPSETPLMQSCFHTTCPLPKAPSNEQADLTIVGSANVRETESLEVQAQIPPPSMLDEMNEIMDRLRSGSYATCDIGQFLGIRTTAARR